MQLIDNGKKKKKRNAGSDVKTSMDVCVGIVILLLGKNFYFLFF